MPFIELLKTAPFTLRDRWNHCFTDIEARDGHEDVTGKVVVITGSNGGIGKIVALQMAKRGARVVMACRDALKAENTMKEIKEVVPTADLTTIQLDLSDLDSVRSCAKRIIEACPCVNVLINNAGIFDASPHIQRTGAGFELHLVTNYLGHVLLTMLLLDHLKKGSPSRIVNVSSMGYQGAVLDPEDLNLKKQTYLGSVVNVDPYCNSKKLQVLFGRKLGQSLAKYAVNVYCMCPGTIAATDLYTNESWLSWAPWLMFQAMKILVGCSLEQGASTVMYCALATRCANETGQMYQYGRIWPRANQKLDEEELLARRIWNSTEKLLGISFEKYLGNS